MTWVDYPRVHILEGQSLIKSKRQTAASGNAVGVGTPVIAATGVDNASPIVKAATASDTHTSTPVIGFVSSIVKGFPTDPDNRLRYIPANTAREVIVTLCPHGTYLILQSDEAYDSSNANGAYFDLAIGTIDAATGLAPVELDYSTLNASVTGLMVQAIGVWPHAQPGEPEAINAKILCRLVNGVALA